VISADVVFGPIRYLLGALRCLRAMLALAALLALAMVWVRVPAHSRLRRALPVAGWRLLLVGFGIRIRYHGAPADPAEALIVANHVSWTDIVVLGRLLDAGFIAKAEVAGWPILGALAQRYGCLFIARERRAATHALVADMSAYPAGAGLVLFAEGTTGLGDGVLPFHSGLFATGARWPKVQPVTIAYRRADGSALSPPMQRRVAWIGDDALLPHALSLAASARIVADVWFESSFVPENRKQAALVSRQLIADRLAALAIED
jgi:1-acyl-sn-glycerol-3-phosphate acyltransferase